MQASLYRNMPVQRKYCSYQVNGYKTDIENMERKKNLKRGTKKKGQFLKASKHIMIRCIHPSFFSQNVDSTFFP